MRWRNRDSNWIFSGPSCRDYSRYLADSAISVNEFGRRVRQTCFTAYQRTWRTTCSTLRGCFSSRTRKLRAKVLEVRLFNSQHHIIAISIRRVPFTGICPMYQKRIQTRWTMSCEYYVHSSSSAGGVVVISTTTSSKHCQVIGQISVDD